MALIASQAIEEVKGFVEWFLEGKFNKEQRETVAEFLTGGYTTHDRPLSFETMKGLGLPVKRGVPSLVFELFTTCEFGVCKRPCVAHYGVAPAP